MQKTKGKFPWRHHVVWNGKTKHASWKGLLWVTSFSHTSLGCNGLLCPTSFPGSLNAWSASQALRWETLGTRLCFAFWLANLTACVFCAWSDLLLLHSNDYQSHNVLMRDNTQGTSKTNVKQATRRKCRRFVALPVPRRVQLVWWLPLHFVQLHHPVNREKRENWLCNKLVVQYRDNLNLIV